MFPKRVDSGLYSKLFRLERNGKLYSFLVHRPAMVLRYGLQMPEVLSAADYSQKFLPFIKHWEPYEEVDGCYIQTVRKTVLKNRGWVVPRWLVVEDADCAFRLLGMEERKVCFLDAYHHIVAAFPALSGWCISHYRILALSEVSAAEVVSIADYLVSGPQRDCNIKQWQFRDVDTKFHKKHFEVLRSLANELLGLDLSNREEFFRYFNLEKEMVNLEVLFLDPEMYVNGVSHAAMTADDMNRWFRRPKYVFIFENKANGGIVGKFVKHNYPCIFVYGVGKAISVLKDVSWLVGCKIFYAGDLDRRGFEMLSDVRKFLPQTESLLMDSDTLSKVLDFKNPHPEKRGAFGIPRLTPSEEETLFRIVNGKVRVEQEKYCDLLVVEVLAILEKSCC